MTTITFVLDQNNELICIDNQTGFPSSIPLTIEGLTKLKNILHASDQAMVKKYQKMWETQHGEELARQADEKKHRAEYEAQRRENEKQKQMKELEELF